MNIIDYIFRKSRTNKVFKQIEKLDSKYFAGVSSKWKEHNYSEAVWCYPINLKFKDSKMELKLSTGIELGLKSPQTPEIILVYFYKEDIDLIKKYVTLRGFDVAKVVKADWDDNP